LGQKNGRRGPGPGNRKEDLVRTIEGWETLRCSGQTSILLNRTQGVPTGFDVPVLPGERWWIALFGSSVDTEVLVRDLTLWRGERYPPEEEAGPR